MAAQTSVRPVVEDHFTAPATRDPTVVFDRVIGAHSSCLVAYSRRSSEATMSTLTALAARGQTRTLDDVGDTHACLLRSDPAGRLECRWLTQDQALVHPDMRSRLTWAMGLDDANNVGACPALRKLLNAATATLICIKLQTPKIGGGRLAQGNANVVLTAPKARAEQVRVAGRLAPNMREKPLYFEATSEVGEAMIIKGRLRSMC